MTPRFQLFTLLAVSLLSAPAVTHAQDPESAGKPRVSAVAPAEPKGSGITEDQIRAKLTNKLLFLRGFYLDDTLKFNESGQVIGAPRKGSFTLCAVEIKKVKLTKHALELEGDRYGLHFYGALPYEDDSKPFDRVRLTGKKSKSVKITIDRELVVIPKVKKPKKGETQEQAKASTSPSDPDNAPAQLVAVDAAAAAPEAKDPNAVTTTSSPVHSAKLMENALANVFADRIDSKMMASLPDYWQYYYQDKVNHKEFMPANTAVLRVGGDVTAPKILNGLEPGSNEFAQKNGIAGLTLFRTVVDAQGKPAEIAIARPIGFGLDEKAIEAIRKSNFKPATKDGQPVPVVVDLVVTFRIFSNRTRGGQIPEPEPKADVTQAAALPHGGVTPGTGR
jgi:TonB family protein